MPNEYEGAGERVRKIEIDRKQTRRTEGERGEAQDVIRCSDEE